MTPPDPAIELRMTSLHATRGANYWSRRPVTRLDIAVGAYEHISSADVPGFTQSLVSVMPGLEEHRCSIGERGGFITRLERGTYAAHIIEHIALELQSMIGHDVGFGRTRGGDVDGEFTIVFEHLHEGVGLRAAALALEIVQRAFAGTLGPVDYATAELAALAQTPDVPALQQHVLCGITGGALRTETRDEIVKRGFGNGELIVDVSPAYLLQAGLPYSRSEIAIILDSILTDVPERYRDEERAQRLVATVADAVDRGGIVVVPAKDWEVQDLVRDAGCRVAIFAPDADITRRDRKVARAAAYADKGRIIIETRRSAMDAGQLIDGVPAAAQVAAALAVMTLTELNPNLAAAGSAQS
jgi:cyanophycin synthetase